MLVMEIRASLNQPLFHPFDFPKGSRHPADRGKNRMKSLEEIRSQLSKWLEVRDEVNP
jgi:hypothetical protein